MWKLMILLQFFNLLSAQDNRISKFDIYGIWVLEEYSEGKIDKSDLVYSYTKIDDFEIRITKLESHFLHIINASSSHLEEGGVVMKSLMTIIHGIMTIIKTPY